MPYYNFTAMNTAGKRVRQRIEASSLETAKASLRSTGYLVLDIKAQSDLNPEIDLPFLGNPKPKDMAVFCRQFGSILKAGVPIATALSMLGQQTENKKLREAIRAMQGDLEKGSTLADSMRRQPKVFSGMLTSMAAAGEESGNLEAVLEQMEIYFDKATRTRNAVGRAMIYPAILIIVMVIVLFVMMTRIIPGFLKTFEEMDAELPALTQGIMAVSDWFGDWWWLLALIIVGLIVGGRLFGKTNRGKHFFGALTRKRNFTVKSHAATFCRTQALLQASGLDLMESLELTADNMNNIWYKEAVLEARTQVSHGVSLAHALRDTGLFPSMVCNMVGIGEESGDLVGMLAKTADYYDEEVEQATQKLLALMEPAIIIFMAGFVVIIVLSIFLPMLNMTKAYDQYL